MAFLLSAFQDWSYRIEDSRGQRYWLYRRGLYGGAAVETPEWFLHGFFA